MAATPRRAPAPPPAVPTTRAGAAREFALYMSSLPKTKERLVRDADRLVAEDRKLRASTPLSAPPVPPKPPPRAPDPAVATPRRPPNRGAPRAGPPLSLDYRNEQHTVRRRIVGGFLVQPATDPDFLPPARFQGRLPIGPAR